MAEQGFPAQHTTTTSKSASMATTIRYDPGYIRTRPGILKIVKIILDLLGFICIEVSGLSFMSRGQFFNTAAMMGFWFSGIMLALYLFHAVEKFYKIPWLKIEFVYYAVLTLFYLIASSLAVSYGNEAYSAAGFFGFCAMLAYGYDAFLKFGAIRTGTLEQGVKVVSRETTSPADVQTY